MNLVPGRRAAGLFWVVLCAVPAVLAAPAEPATPGPTATVAPANPRAAAPVSVDSGRSYAANLAHGTGLLIEQPQFTFDNHRQAPVVISLLVFSDPPERLTGLKVDVLSLRKPDGSPLTSKSPRDLLKPTDPPAAQEVPPTGVPVTYTLLPSDFPRPGIYKAVVRAEAVNPQNETRSVVAEISLTFPAATLNTGDFADLTLPLTRRWPRRSARVNPVVELPLRETSGNCDLESPRAASGLIIGPGGSDDATGRQLVGGRLALAFETPDRIPAGQSGLLRITPDRFDRAGTFTTHLTINSPSLAAPADIALRIRVTDHPLWPLLAIACGVLGGLVVSLVVQQWRPRELNRYDLVGLAADLQALENDASDDAHLATIKDLERRLSGAEYKNFLGEFTEVQAAVADVNQGLKAFRADKTQQKATVRTSLQTLRGRFALYGALPALPLPDKEKLTRGEATLADVEKLLTADKVDAGQEQFSRTVLPAAQAVFKDVLVGWKGRLENEIKTLPDPASFNASLTDLNTALAGADPDAARDKLTALAQAVETSRNAPPPAAQGARQNYSLTAGSPVAHHPRHAAPPSPAIVILTPPLDRTMNTPIYFGIEPVPDAKTEIQWSFQGEAVPTTAPSVSRAFSAQGEYGVTAFIQAASAGRPATLLSERFDVLPGKVERTLRTIRYSLFFSEVILMGISLLLAILTGMYALYFNKPFGTLADYLGAIVWGFGLDTGVRGFSNVLQKLRTGGAVSTP